MRVTLREWIARLMGAFGRGRDDGDIEQELQAHLAIVEEDLRRKGMSPDAAAREARLRIGRTAQTMELLRDRRGIPPLSTFWLDAKLGLRMLRKHWALTLIGGLAMTATMTVGSAVFNFISVLLGTSVPLDEGDRVVIVQPFDPGTRQQRNPEAQVFEHWREKMHSLVNVGAFRTVERDLKTNQGFGHGAMVAEMSAAGFALARIGPLMGRPLRPNDERPGAPPVVVIGYDAWQSIFAADPGIVGQQAQLDGVFHTVVGVMPQGFRFPMSHQYWTSLHPQPADPVAVFARLAPGATFESAQAELEGVGFGAAGPLSESGRPLRPFVRPYIVGLTGERSLGMAALLPFILPLLLIPPCTNIGALIYARTVARQGEFAVRTALGASRGRIVTQIFIEVLVLASAAAVVAIVLAPKLAEKISHGVAFQGQPFWVEFSVSYGTILFTCGLALVAALITGVIPAMRATGRWQAGELNAHRSSPPRLGKGWTTIVVAQVALAVAVVPIAVEFAWTTLRPAIVGPGFPIEEFLTARLDLPAPTNAAAAAVRFRGLSAEVARKLLAEPGVTAVTMSLYKPFGEENVPVEIDASGQGPQYVIYNEVDTAFFPAFGIRLLTGRGFSPADADPRQGTILVNRSFVDDHFPGGNALGQSVRLLSQNSQAVRYEIVGLVENQFDYSDQPTIYRPLPPVAPVRGNGVVSVNLAVHLAPALPPDFAVRLHEIATAVDPALRVDDIEPLNDVYFFLSLIEYIGGTLPALVAMGVLLFATVGIYTQMSFDVVQRRREIGIRAALGASSWKLVVGMFRSVFVPVSIGGGVGCLIAVALDFYLSPLLFSSAGGRSLPWILPAAEAFVLLMAVIALFGPVRRTLQVEATEALREG